MNLAAETFVTGRSGKEYRLVPLTVRQRMALCNLLEERARRNTAADCMAAGMSKEDTVQAIKAARDKAGLITTLVQWAFTVEGSHAILEASVGAETIDGMLEDIDLNEAGVHACAALGLDIRRYQDASGNA